jgi:hypothetical protein
LLYAIIESECARNKPRLQVGTRKSNIYLTSTFNGKLQMTYAILAHHTHNKYRVAIIACCGKRKCSSAFSKVLTGRKNSSSIDGNKNTRNKNSNGMIGTNGKV